MITPSASAAAFRCLRRSAEIPWPNLLLILVAFVGITGFLAQERRSEGRGKTGRGDGVMFSTPRLIAAAAALAIVVAVVVWIYRQGGDEVRTSIERQNNKAGRTADDVRSRFDLCPAGMWNFGAGKCRLSPASGGRLAESP
ncbi:hypothetical protein BMJ34_24680 [Sinorhizobium medicae]|uniref:Transmembrane protein n=1 Tax=Sinorhizobium medicae (strain WSM419) TaxID=366394 RepID=A6UIU3_SINMW|nr:hypothetical protein Smed_4776 [Sinorhizobium medicae WSM419]PLT92199.1 hypothetical protein BMJ34_24680 [Sinorhizobium medicae]PLU12908.1 hypothetical protein BMJ30_26930 [Sinorhizobium medicae]PLU33422.1 hypothetical protein BMJ27_17475 [Sinorhizobium medicae]PLU41575.1 hypothetical protein BMJ26_06160 [Sinorhizobium medicae]